MVTAILPTMTLARRAVDSRSPSCGANGTSHTMTPSISSELTITPARFQSREPMEPVDADRGASTSRLAGLVGMFSGCGALVALLLFLPLPTRFQKAGVSPSNAIADSFYVVGAVALLVALACLFGLRGLPGEEEKGIRRLLHPKDHKATESDEHAALSYPRLLWTSIALAFRSRDIGLGYLGGFVARASSVAISLFIPLFTNAYFLRTGQCSADPADSTDTKHECPRAYLLAAALTGTSQLVALLCAPVFGYLSGRYQRFDAPLIVAAAAGVAGYAAFGALASPDPKSADGSGAVFAVVALLGLSQIGAIVCSLALLGRAIGDEQGASDPADGAYEQHPSAGATPTSSPSDVATAEDEPLLRRRGSASRSPFASHYSATATTLAAAGPRGPLAHLKGSIAGTYSLAGGAGILLLTKAGGALFDSAGPGSPFYMMAAFNGALLAVALALAGREAVDGWLHA